MDVQMKRLAISIQKQDVMMVLANIQVAQAALIFPLATITLRQVFKMTHASIPHALAAKQTLMEMASLGRMTYSFSYQIWVA